MYKQVSTAPAAEEAVPPTGTLDWLRSATSVQHDRVEALVDLAARGLDATSYARLLLAFLPPTRASSVRSSRSTSGSGSKRRWTSSRDAARKIWWPTCAASASTWTNARETSRRLLA